MPCRKRTRGFASLGLRLGRIASLAWDTELRRAVTGAFACALPKHRAPRGQVPALPER